MKGCFELGEMKYCVRVPIEKIWKVPIDFYSPGNPDPFPAKPWLESDAISRETVLDLADLAGIEQLVAGLHSPKLKKALAQALTESLASVELPAEMHVHFDDLRDG